MKTIGFLRREGLQIVFLALPLILAAAFWSHFPQLVATHWDIHGHPNGWMGKGLGLTIMPAVNLGIWALFFYLPRLDPKIHSNPAEHERTVSVLRTWRLATSAFLCLMSLLILAVAGGIPVDMNRTVANGILVLFLVLGNTMGNLRPNYFAGIRTPWTLNDPEIWRATHRIGGRIMVYGSLLLLLVQFFLTAEQLMRGFLVYMVGFAVWSVGYSYSLFRRKAR